MVADVGNINQIIVRQGILNASHPLLYVGRMANGIRDWIESEAHIGEAPLRISRRQHLTVRKCALASHGCGTIAAG